MQALVQDRTHRRPGAAGIGRTAGGAVHPLLPPGAVRGGHRHHLPDSPLPPPPPGADVDGQRVHRRPEHPSAPHRPGLPGGVLPVQRRGGLPGGVSEPHGLPGRAGGLLRRVLRGSAGHSGGPGQPGHHPVRLFLVPGHGGAGLPGGTAGAGRPGAQPGAGGHGDQLSVHRGHLLPQAGGRPHQPAPGDHLLAHGQPVGHPAGRCGPDPARHGRRAAPPVPPAVEAQPAHPGGR